MITNFSFDKQPVRVRIRFQVDHGADVGQVIEVAERTIEAHAQVIDGTAEVVVRSLWDQTRGHLLSGVLLEARYRIQDVTERTRIRSSVIRALLAAFEAEGVHLASPGWSGSDGP